jgi:hypothetical protein
MVMPIGAEFKNANYINVLYGWMKLWRELFEGKNYLLSPAIGNFFHVF